MVSTLHIHMQISKDLSTDNSNTVRLIHVYFTRGDEDSNFETFLFCQAPNFCLVSPDVPLCGHYPSDGAKSCYKINVVSCLQ